LKVAKLRVWLANNVFCQNFEAIYANIKKHNKKTEAKKGYLAKVLKALKDLRKIVRKI